MQLGSSTRLAWQHRTLSGPRMKDLLVVPLGHVLTLAALSLAETLQKGLLGLHPALLLLREVLQRGRHLWQRWSGWCSPKWAKMYCFCLCLSGGHLDAFWIAGRIIPVSHWSLRNSSEIYCNGQWRALGSARVGWTCPVWAHRFPLLGGCSAGVVPPAYVCLWGTQLEDDTLRSV